MQTFTDEDKNEFSLMEGFGVDIASLKSIIEMKSSERLKADQPGIPKDSLDNQLADWLKMLVKLILILMTKNWKLL